MARYSDQTTTQVAGETVPLPGVTIYVYDSTGALATLTNDDSSALSNPFNSDTFGNYAFNTTAAIYRADYWFGGKRIYSQSILVGIPPAFKGDPGGNIMAIGSFATAAAGITIPSGTTVIRTSEYRTGSGKGGGFYKVDSAVNSAYVAAHPGHSFLSADARGWRLDDRQWLTFEMFGAYGDCTSNGDGSGIGTDDHPAWLVAEDFLVTYRRFFDTNQDYRPTPPLHFDSAAYYSTQTINLASCQYTLLGSPNGALETGGSHWYFAPSVGCGFILQNWDTTGTSGSKSASVAPFGASGTIIRDIVAHSTGGTVGAEQHGFLVRCYAEITHCSAVDWGGEGFRWRADHGQSYAGNCNGAIIRDCQINRCGGSGVMTEGSDANSMIIENIQVNECRQFAIRECSGLGTRGEVTYITAGCGIVGKGPAWDRTSAGTLSSLSGHRYRVRPGQHVGASTNSPSGTTASNTWWTYMQDGDTGGGVWPAWVSGTAYVSGGTLYCGNVDYTLNNNTSSKFSGYAEGASASPWFDAANAGILAGQTSPLLGGNGNYLDFFNNGVVSNKIGSHGIKSDGTQLDAGWGGDPNNANQVLYFAIGGVVVATGHYDPSANTLSFQYLGASSQNPITFNFSGSGAGMSFPRGIQVQNIYLYSGTAAPTTGTWILGTIVKNSAPAVGSPKGWVCTVAGTPGTWVSEGNL